MRFTPWATRLVLTLSLSATAALTACGGGDDDDGGGNAQVRLLNATRSFSTLNLKVNDKDINTNVAYASVGEYASVDINATSSNVTNSVGTSISATTPTLAGGSNYTYITYGFAGAVRTTLLQETEAAPTDNTRIKLLVLNLAPDAGALDIYLTSAADCSLANDSALTSNLQGGFPSGYLSANAGTFRICVTGAGKKADLRLNMPSVVMDQGSVNTLILTASDGGVLVNGITLVQKGAVKNFPNTQSRVRTVAALSAAGQVTSSVNGATMFNSVPSPLISEYVTTASGVPTQFSIAVNGTAMTVAAPTLTAGKDTTLLVWGNPADPKVAVLDDDNRLPTSASDIKVRLVNALSTGGAGLNVSFGSVASNVGPGSASTFTTTSASTTGVQVDLNVPAVGTIYTNPALVFPAGSVWTFFAVPTTAATTTTAPVLGFAGLPKRERP